MKKLLLLLFMQMAMLTAFAQTKHTVTGASVTYQIKNLGFTTKGKFGGLQGTIAFDQQNLATSSITATIDVKTVDSDDEARDEHLRKADFFDVEHYPVISVKSVSFKKKSGDKYSGVFDLTIKNKTKRLEIPFTYVETGVTAVFNGSFKINRLDFGVGDESLTLSNEAIITVNIQTAR